jgi:LacI family gluconate utilization system Gnt-I transcriptional repressor
MLMRLFVPVMQLRLGYTVKRTAKGIQVPTDLAITGFGDFDYARDSGVGLTTVRINGEKIGQITSELISESNNGVDISGRVVDLGFEVVRRLTS